MQGALPYGTRRVVVAAIFIASLATAQGSWRRVKPASSPRARYLTAMAYDPVRDRTVLFGGMHGSYPHGPKLNDTWEWDGTTWRDVTPKSGNPPARAWHAMTYHAGLRRVVLCAGAPAWGRYLADLWAWDGARWTRISTLPEGRDAHALAYDVARRRLIVFGGGVRGRWTNDTLEWDGRAWTRFRGGAPSARGYVSMAYVSGLRESVLVGGNSGAAETWSFNGSRWLSRAAHSALGPRSNYGLVHDSRRDVVVLFGGGAGATAGGTWEWGAGAGWVQAPTGKTAPTSRSGHAMAFDSRRGATWIFGGGDKTGELDDTWEYRSAPLASWAAFGVGCPGGNGKRPRLAASSSSRPRFAAVFELTVSNLPASPRNVPFVWLGSSRRAWGSIQLPLRLGISAPGCSLLVAPDVVFALSNVAGVGRWRLKVPALASVYGAEFFNQAMCFDPGANALGLSWSNGGSGRIGW